MRYSITWADESRCDLFNRAYNHMSGCIDKIYKDLTKGQHFPTGGVGFLSLEDAEVSSPISFFCSHRS